jgi:hypothetical protein
MSVKIVFRLQGRVFKKNMLRTIFVPNMAKQWLLKGFVLYKIGLLLLIKVGAFRCVYVGGAKCIGASEFRSWQVRLKWMEEESCM